MSYPKRHFYAAFAAAILLLAGVQRLCHLALPGAAPTPPAVESGRHAVESDRHAGETTPRKAGRRSRVWSYPACFPDIQDVQIEAAVAAGITPVASHQEVEELVRKQQLVSILHSPYYAVEPLTHSLPYVVPRAQEMLNTIGINFIDSCLSRGLPPHLPVVTSVLRTTEQVARLQRGNTNATTNSCHCYGTTFDIAYTRFQPITGNPADSATRWDEQLKLTLAEVLYDLRADSLCYIKYEHKQACFHMTIRP